MKITRIWAMPNADTFSIQPIGEFVERYLSKSTRSIDPLTRNFKAAPITNDLNPDTAAQYHEKADKFLGRFTIGEKFDLVIFDPPYSPRQMKEVYSGIGLEFTQRDGQIAGRWKEEKDIIDKILEPDGVVLHFGWHTNGMGKKRHYEIEEILIVAHGGAHNDTICMAERKKKDLFN